MEQGPGNVIVQNGYTPITTSLPWSGSKCSKLLGSYRVDYQDTIARVSRILQGKQAKVFSKYFQSPWLKQRGNWNWTNPPRTCWGLSFKVQYLDIPSPQDDRGRDAYRDAYTDAYTKACPLSKGGGREPTERISSASKGLKPVTITTYMNSPVDLWTCSPKGHLPCW